jgi:hypothetical protein
MKIQDYTKQFEDYENTPEPPMSYRRKERKRVERYKSGRIKSVYLNAQTLIKTDIGVIPTELVTFYESGAIRRIFPRYGAISAYWSQQDEASITSKMSFEIGGKTYDCRPMCIHFYESGEVYSITIYDHEKMPVSTGYGDIYTNVGVAFYKDGKIKSLEPVFKTRIEINGKPVYPFCFFANHMHADNNSLVFDESGTITSFYGQQREETKCQKKVI